jgi:chromosomal replication initiator protein
MNVLTTVEPRNVAMVIKRAEMVIESMTGKIVKLHSSNDLELNGKFLLLKKLVCVHFGVTWEDILSLSRDRKSGLTDARHTYMYLAHEILKFTHVEIARQCHKKDHTTVVHACKKIKGFYDVGESLAIDVETIKNKLLA